MSDGAVKKSFRDRFGALLVGNAIVMIAVMVVIASVGIVDVVPQALAVPVMLVLVGLVAWFTRSRWGDLGLRRPASWFRVVIVGIGVGITSQLVAGFLLIPLLKRLGVEPADYSGFQRTVGSLLLYLVVAWTTAGFGEEVIYRGFLMGQLNRIFGDGRIAGIVTVVLVSFLFGLGHLYQGAMGVLLVTYSGLVFGTLYLLTGRNLWYTIIAHGTADTMAFIFVYTGLMDRFM